MSEKDFNFDLKGEHFLSADVLFDCIVAQKSVALPSIGEKKEMPTGSFLEGKHTESRLRSLRDAVAYPRVNQRNQLAEGFWDGELKLVKVIKAVGRHWKSLGHVVDGQLCLYPEEALFLLECNNLLITFGEVDMSLQQGYELLLNDGCSLEEYWTFSTLSRLGYKVVRHQGDLGITFYERQIRLDRYQKKRKLKDRRLGPQIELVLDEPTPKKSTNVDISFSNTPAIVEDVSVDMNVTNEPTTSNVDNLSVDNLSDLEENPGDKIENCSNQDTVGENVKDGALAVLWKCGKTTPRLSPSQSSSSTAILSKLQFKTPSFLPELAGSKLKISYDMYLPSVVVRKSIPKPPNYRIVIVKSDSKVPSSADITATLGPLKDGVPLILAVVATSNVSFFSFSHVGLPTNPSIDDSLPSPEL